MAMRSLNFHAKYHSLLLIFSLIFATTTFADNTLNLNSNIAKSADKISLPFIENSGQYDSQVLFYSETFGGTAFVTVEGELVYSIPLTSSKQIAIKESFSFESPRNISGFGKIPTTITNFHGKSWQSNQNSVSAYNGINLGEISEGITVNLSANANNIEKIFTVNPNIDPNSINITIDGCENLSVSENGELIIAASSEFISFTAPYAYQDFTEGRKSVDVEYWVSGNSYGFTLGEYDTSSPLTIDPMLASTYLGGSNGDDSYEPAIQIDSQGYVYITGFTYSTNFPTTTGVFDTEFTGFPSMERFVTKYTPDLSEIVASTFIGGSGDDWGMGICFDAEENLYIGGYTNSNDDFPLTDSSYVSENLGGLDVYIVKLTNDLTTLLGSTVFGGSLDDGFQWPRMNIEVGQSGNVYAVGLTKSFNFPFTNGAFDSTYAGGFQCNGGDAFVVSLNANLTELLGATYVGGTGDEWRVDLALDSEENVIITGDTYSPDLSTTPGAYHPDFDYATGTYVVFVSKYSSDMTELLASTFIGGHIGYDDPLAIIVDQNDNICVSGFTYSNFVTTAGAFDRTYNGNADIFVTVFDNNLSSVLYSTLVGGSGDDQGADLKIDSEGNFFVVGITTSTNLPSHPDGNAYDNSFNGESDIFVIKLDSELSNLLGSTYVGASGTDKGKQLAIGIDGNVFVSCITNSTDLPTTPESENPDYNGGPSDIYIFKISPNLQSIVSGVSNEECVPTRSFLMDNFPNPFNAQTKIQFVLEQAAPTSVKIYDISGRLVSTLMQASGNVGQNSVVWNGTNSSGENVSSGTYFFEVASEGFRETGKMLLLK
jgi:FlgD Ig-like domain/Beta-propeller repeat